MRNPSRAGIFLLSGCDHMITFFHVIISLLSGLGNTAAGCLWHPGEDWRGEKAEGGVVTKTDGFSWGFHVDMF